MGVLYDLVIADEGAAKAIGTTKRLFEDFRVFPTKMLDPVTLDGLFSLIDPASPEIESWWKDPLYEEEELSVYQLPPFFIDKLSHLLEQERSQLAQRWGQTEEMQCFYKMYDLTSAEIDADTSNLVDDLCWFASEANERGKRIFLRCLP